jgi:peptidoglycan/LPS O-acetylase OafA/YrhL
VRASTAIGIALALLTLSPLLRALTLVAQGGATTGLQGRFHLIVDAIMIGCLIALLANFVPRSRLLRVLRSSWLVAPSVAFLLLHSAIVPRASAVAGVNLLPLGLSIRAIAVGSLLAWTLSREGSRPVALLSSRAMTHIGVISYSLYLWQQPFCDSSLRLPMPALWPLRLVGCFVAAELSHRLVERPALALRKRWFDSRSTAVAGSST